MGLPKRGQFHEMVFILLNLDFKSGHPCPKEGQSDSSQS